MIMLIDTLKVFVDYLPHEWIHVCHNYFLQMICTYKLNVILKTNLVGILFLPDKLGDGSQAAKVLHGATAVKWV